MIYCLDCGYPREECLACEECGTVACPCDVTNVYCQYVDVNLCDECANAHRIACPDCARR